VVGHAGWHDRRTSRGSGSGANNADGQRCWSIFIARKTAALITASLVSGGIYAGAKESEVKKLRAFGRSIGLAFQIVDDVLDVTQTSEQLGKTAGKDTAAQKATYPALFGIEESARKADALVSAALRNWKVWRKGGHAEGVGSVSGGAEEVSGRR